MDLFPVLVGVCAVAMLAIVVATVAVTGRKRVRNEVEEQSGRILMLELELATLRRELVNAPAADAHAKTEACEPPGLRVESNTPEREHSILNASLFNDEALEMTQPIGHGRERGIYSNKVAETAPVDARDELTATGSPQSSHVTLLPPIATTPMTHTPAVVNDVDSLDPATTTEPRRQGWPQPPAWELPKHTEYVSVPLKEELAALNSLAKIGIMLLVLGAASWRSRPSDRPTSS